MFYWQGPCVYGVKLLALFVALKSQGQGWILVQVINMYWKLFSSLLRILTALKATEVLRKVRALSHVLSLAQRCSVLDFLPWFTGPRSSYSVWEIFFFLSAFWLPGCRDSYSIALTRSREEKSYPIRTTNSLCPRDILEEYKPCN